MELPSREKIRGLTESEQDKQAEMGFFAAHAAGGEYNVFTPDTNRRLLKSCLELAGLESPARVADVGCASGAFTGIMAAEGFDAIGIDITPAMVELAGRLHPGVHFVVGDAENLPFPDESLDGVLLSAVLHHLPDPTRCAREVWRVLKPGGKFASFDPNRLNPFMYLYRDRTSPFYSSRGVTPNERPVLAGPLVRIFSGTGFAVRTAYLGGLRYRYVASPLMSWFLPAYNVMDGMLINSLGPRWMRPFVILAGVKRAGSESA